MFSNARKICTKTVLIKCLNYTTSHVQSKSTVLFVLINKYFYSSFYRPKLGNRNSNFKFNNHLERNNDDVRSINYENLILSEAFQSFENQSEQDWSNVRSKILENEFNRNIFTLRNIDAAIMGFCTKHKKYDMGSAYIKYLESQHTKPNLATIGKYLRLLYIKNEENKKWKCDTVQEQEIFGIYENLRKEYPVLDSITAENVLVAFSITKRWQMCLELLQEIKVSSSPSAGAYSAAAAACFLNKNENTGWTLLEELLGLEKLPRSVAYLSYLETLKNLRKKENIMAKLEKLFLFLKEYELKCEEPVIRRLCEFSEKMGIKSQLIEVPFKGFCSSCKQQLQTFVLNENEFEELKSKFFENVVLGRDLFTRTNPQELENFRNFVQGMGKFDVVLDGLNIAYSGGSKQGPQLFALMVATVVEHFVNQNKSVLVLGRVHMNRWPRNDWNYVKQNATVFLTQNISQDDPYLLYCALHSGKDTIVVTKDLMRSHKFLLKQPKYKTWFNRWLTQRQYQLIRVDSQRRPIFRIPPPFSVMAQKKDNIWHIPYQKEQTAENEEFHKTWLCMELNC